MSVSLGSAHGDIVLDGSGAAKGVSQAVGALGDLERVAASVGGSFARFAVGLGVAATQATVAIGTGLAGATAIAVKTAGDLQQAVANIASIKPEINTTAVFNALNDLSTKVPQTANQLADSLYNIFSSIETTQEGAIALVEKFAQGAIGAQTDAETFGTAILGVMNAYGVAVEDAGHITDVFFNTVNRGVVTGDELARQLGQVTQSAKLAGVSIDELGALIAGVTKEGGPASVNINNLNNLLTKITTTKARDELEKLGVSVVGANGDFRSILDILGDLKPKLEGMTEAQRANALQAIFPDLQARAGAATILSQLDFVNEALAENQSQAGSTERAFAKMVSTFNSQAGLLRNTAVAVGRAFGAELLPLATQGVSGLQRLLAGATPTITAFGRRLAASLTSAVEDFGDALPRIIARAQNLFDAITEFFRALRGKGSFDSVRESLLDAFDDSIVGDFASRAVRLIQLVRDAILSAQQAARGEWFGGQDRSINVFVRTIARAVQLVRDAILTVRQAFAGDWMPSDQIQPVVNALGRIAKAAGEIWRALQTAGRALADAFTPERIAILQKLWDQFLSLQRTVNGIRLDILVGAMELLARAIAAAAPYLADFVGSLIDFIGRAQEGGREADILRAALVLLGAWVASNKLADLVTSIGNIGKAATTAAGQVSNFWQTLTRGPRLVISTIRTVYETVGKAIDLGQQVGGTVVRTIQTAFASAKDAAIWAQLYGEQAVQTITRTIKTVYEQLPSPPSLPDLVQKVIPQVDTSGLGSTQLPSLKMQVEPTIKPTLNLGSVATDLGTKLAGGIAAGIGAAIGAAIAGSAIAATVGTALLVVIGAAIVPIAIVLATRFVTSLIVGLVQAQGGIGPAISALFTQAIPFALGALSGLLINFGLQLVVWMLQGFTQGIPALISFVTSNLQSIVIALGLIFAPIPTIIFGIVTQIGPIFANMAAQVLAAIGSAFSQIGTIISTTLGTLGALVQSTVSAVIGVFLSMGAQIIAAVQSAFAPIGAFISAIISGDWLGAVQAGIQLLVNIFVTLPQQIFGILSAGFGQIAGIILDALGAAASAVGTAFSSIVSVVQEAGSQILSAVTGAFNTVLSTITSILSGIGDAIARALSSFVQGFSSTFNGDLVTQVQQGLGKLKDAVTQGVQAAADLVGQLPGKMLAALGDLGGVLFSAGAAVVQGFIDGIGSMIGAVVNKAKEIANAIPGPIKNLLGIQSPSKVMAEVGKNVGEGLAQGMDNISPEVAKAAQDLASTIADTVKSGVEALSSLGRVQGVSDQSLALFSSGLRRLIAALVALADEFSGDAVAAAKTLAGDAKGVIDLVVPAVEAFDALAEIRGITGDSLGVFTDGMRNLVAAIVAVAADFKSEALDAASEFADAASKMLALIGPAVEAFDKLAKVSQPSADQLGVLLSGLSNLALILVEAAGIVGLDALPFAVAFAEAGTKIVALVVPAVEAFAALRDVVQPTADQLGVFMSGITNLVSVVIQASQLFAAEAFPHATEFADLVQKSLGLIVPAVAAFDKLKSIVQPTADQLGVFMSGITNVASVIEQASRLFADETIAHATSFADYAAKAIGLVSSGIDAFAKLSNGDLKFPSQSDFDAFGASVASLARAIANAASTIAQRAVADAGAFSEQAQKAVALLGAGVEGLSKLVDFRAPTDAAIAAFIATVVNVVRRVADASRTIEKEAAAAAATFAEHAGKAVQLIGTAISALTIKEAVDKEGNPKDVSRLISAGEVDALVSLIGYVTRRMIDLGKQFSAGDLAKVVALADAASKGIAALGDMMDTIDAATKPKEGDAATLTPSQVIDNLIALFTQGLARLALLANVAEQYKRAAFGIRDTMQEAMAAIAASLGTLPFGTGIGAAQLALATSNGQFLIRAEVIHRHDPVQFTMMTENGPWIARSLEIDGKSREQVAAMVADLLMGDGS